MACIGIVIIIFSIIFISWLYTSGERICIGFDSLEKQDQPDYIWKYQYNETAQTYEFVDENVSKYDRMWMYE